MSVFADSNQLEKDRAGLHFWFNDQQNDLIQDISNMTEEKG